MKKEMNILERIVVDKKREVLAKKKAMPVQDLRAHGLFKRKTRSMRAHLTDGSGIIAEYKRRSPSRQVINQKSSVQDVVQGYHKAGVSACSILTDSKYFGGSLDDFVQARAVTELPLLRKDFMLDPYQIEESKAYGADVVLLIAAILTKEEIYSLGQLAKVLGMEVLLEVHNRQELEKSPLDFVDMVGVNNRNLKTFEVDLGTSEDLATLIPNEKLKVSESGISSLEAVVRLKEYGYQGFLMGENFMKTEDPAGAAETFIKAL